MPDLGNSRRKLKIAIGAMLAADVVAAAVLFSPLVGSADSRTLANQRTACRTDQENPRRANRCAAWTRRSCWRRIRSAGFTRTALLPKDSDLTNELGKLASENGVRIQQARYKEEDAETSGVDSGRNRWKFSGDYLQLVRFINTLERSKMFFEVDSVDLAGESAGPVKLEITIHSYLRSGA